MRSPAAVAVAELVALDLDALARAGGPRARSVAQLDLDALTGRGGGAGRRVVAELVALDLDALAAVVALEHVASPSSTSMCSPAAVAARVAEHAAVAMRWSSIAAPDLVVAAVVVAELVALDLDALAVVVTIEHVAAPSSTSMRSRMAVVAAGAELAVVADRCGARPRCGARRPRWRRSGGTERGRAARARKVKPLPR